MASIINTNLQSINAQRNLSTSSSSLAVSMQRLSTGLRVNSAKDDAAGLSIATRMDSQVRGMNVAIRNANDGISMAQTAESALGSVTDSLQRMRELAVQARNSTNSFQDVSSLNEEYTQLSEEIARVLGGTTFNGKHILGAEGGELTFQIGANTTNDDTIKVTTKNMTTNSDIEALTDYNNNDTAGLFIKDDLDAVTVADDTTRVDAQNTAMSNVSDHLKDVIDALDKAIDTVNSERATLGAVQSRFDAVISNLQSAAENQTAARSRIMDADFAAETANLSRTQVLQQAGNAMVALANQAPQQVLALLPR